MAEKKGKTNTPGKAAGAGTKKSAAKKPPVKATKSKTSPAGAAKKTKFTLHAPDAAEVFLAGFFNDWNPAANPLKRNREGAWTCTVLLEPGEHEYRFVVDSVWWDDPLNSRRRPTEFGCENCIVIV